MTFSYDPTQINDGGLNQMRFFLGDVLVEEPEKSAYLCDEEILATLDGTKTFKRAALRLVESLLFRFSYEVNTEVHDAKWDLSDRVKAWQDLYKRLKADIELEETASAFGLRGIKNPPPIFRIGMNDWRRR